MREDQIEYQQQIMETLEKVSYQVKKVENISNGSVPALEGYYYTPLASQIRVNIPSKLSAPPNLPTLSGRELVTRIERSIDQWLFQVEGALATHTEEVVRSAVIRSIRVANHKLLEFINYGEEMSVILRHIKEQFGQGLSKAKLQKEFFLMDKERQKVLINLLGGWNSNLSDCVHCILVGMTIVN